MTISRRALLAGAAGGWALAGCSSTPGEGPLPRNGRFDDVTVRISAIADTYVQGFRLFEQQLADRGLHMQFDVTPPQDAYTKDMLEFKAERSSHDIVLFQPANLADYSHHLHAIDKVADRYRLDFALDDIESVYRSIYTSWQGTVYSVPWDGDQHGLYYNRVAFERAENRQGFADRYGYELAPPQTWSQFRDVAEFMADIDWNGDGRRKYGVAEAWQRGGYSYWWWTDRFASRGGVWFTDDMEPLIDSAAGIRGLEDMVGILDFVPPGTTNYGSPELAAALLTETAPMAIHWSSVGKNAMDPDASDIVGKIGVSLVPGVETAGGEVFRRPALPTGWACGIPLYSDRVAAAAHLLEYVSTPAHALNVALNSPDVDPWRISTFAARKQLTGRWGREHAGYGRQYLDVLKRTLRLGLPDLQIPGSFEYVDAADRAIAAALTEQKSAADALHDAADEWDAITDEIGRDSQTEAWRSQADAMRRAGITYRPELSEG